MFGDERDACCRIFVLMKGLRDTQKVGLQFSGNLQQPRQILEALIRGGHVGPVSRFQVFMRPQN